MTSSKRSSPLPTNSLEINPSLVPSSCTLPSSPFAATTAAPAPANCNCAALPLLAPPPQSRVVLSPNSSQIGAREQSQSFEPRKPSTLPKLLRLFPYLDLTLFSLLTTLTSTHYSQPHLTTLRVRNESIYARPPIVNQRPPPRQPLSHNHSLFAFSASVSLGCNSVTEAKTVNQILVGQPVTLLPCSLELIADRFLVALPCTQLPNTDFIRTSTALSSILLVFSPPHSR